MTTIQVDILNPKAAQLLQDLAELNLISIREIPEDKFLGVVNRIRTKAATKGNLPFLEDITKEVEIVRAKRYAKKNR